eukprot:tig00000382_g24556.t1
MPERSAVEAAAILRQTLKLHEDRVQVYRQFETAFKAYIESKDHAAYATANQQVVSGFNRVNEGVRALQAALKDAQGREDLAALLAAVQVAEKEKFKLTIERHLLMKAQLIDITDEDEAEEKEPVYKAQLQRNAREIAEAIDSVNEALSEVRIALDELGVEPEGGDGGS